MMSPWVIIAAVAVMITLPVSLVLKVFPVLESSFGADRIYDVLLQLNLFPEATGAGTKALVVNFGGDELPVLLKLTAFA